MSRLNTLIIDNREVVINDEKNLLELIRKSGIDLPTFCYHSDLSVYGACRLCMVDIEDRGLVASCSIKPEPGMKVKTHTDEIRNIRKTIVELLLANHNYNCTTCSKNDDCQLQGLARKVGIKDLKYKSTLKTKPVDTSSPSIIRDPNRCILCGDCVRMCSEIQTVNAIDFAHRGSKAAVLPSFGKDLNSVECINCGQCIKVCPTGALTIHPEINKAWKAINDKSKKVVVQIAPAVRVALGEKFGLEPGKSCTGKIVSALKIMGVDKVFDTSFAADLTILEETNEFLTKSAKGKLPLFTSCCPGWVKFAEQYYPELLPNLSSCKSPQQMFGSVAKNILSKDININKEEMTVISIMPCTAKKFEAKRPEFEKDGVKEVDIVLTTQELAHMIDEHGINFHKLAPESLDMPFGFKTGAGIIFGASGGVSEAVLRYAQEKITGNKNDNYEFKEIRGEKNIKTIETEISGNKIRIAVVNGLGAARKVIESIKDKTAEYDLIEVMACPGGCIGGAGQPIPKDIYTNGKRIDGIYETDKTLQLHKSQDNPYINELYNKHLKEPNSDVAHKLLHTCYQNRRRTAEEGISLLENQKDVLVTVSVCIGTSCYTKGSQELVKRLADYINTNNLADKIDLKASFCFEKCGESPNVKVNDVMVSKANFNKVISCITNMLEKEA